MPLEVYHRLRRVAAAGIPLADELHRVELWRVGPNTKIHAWQYCNRIGWRGAQLRPVDVIQAPNSAWCADCRTHEPDGYLGGWLRYAEMLVELQDLLESGDEPVALSINRVAERVDQYTVVYADLAGYARQLVGRARELVGAALVNGERQQQARAHAAAILLDSHLPYKLIEGTPSHYVRGKQSRWAGSTGAGPTHRAWDTVCSELGGGTDLNEALAKGREAALGILDDYFAFELVPDTCRFNAADFAHPRDWAVAEWRAAAVDEIDAALAHWHDRIAKKAAGRGWATVLFEWWNAVERFERLIRPFDPIVDHRSGKAIVSLPAVVAEALDRVGADHEVLAKRRIDKAVLRDALKLFVDDDGNNFAELLDAVELLHS